MQLVSAANPRNKGHGLAVRAERRRDVVVAAEGQTRLAAAQTELQALTAGLAEIAKIAKRLIGRGDKHDVIHILSAKHAGIPLQVFRQLAVQARFPGFGDDLIERRVPSHAVGQTAGLRRIRATEFDCRRRAAAFVVTGIGGECA